MNFYNDFDSKNCAWMQQLIEDKQIPNGKVVCQDIITIKPNELQGYTQHHFFAGVGGWPAAISRAGWPNSRPIWSASLPCQPFSHAGEGKGFEDPRAQLWNPFLELVKVQRPELIVGEQVQAAIGKGWLDRVQADLEAEGYTVGAIVLGAHSVGAPHRRQRIYWMAHTKDSDRGSEQQAEGERVGWSGSSGGGRVGNSGIVRRDKGISRDGRSEASEGSAHWSGADRPSVKWVANGEQSGLEGHAGDGDRGGEPRRQQAEATGSVAASGAWSDFRIIHFRDGSKRRIESSLEPMVARLPKGVVCGSDQSVPIDPQASAEARVMRLHGYGNALTLPVAVAFIQCIMDEYEIPVQINKI